MAPAFCKEVYDKRDGGLLKLKRQEMVSATVYIDGKPLSDDQLGALLKSDPDPEIKAGPGK